MDGLSQEYQTRIANSDGNSEKNEGEKAAIFYISSWAKNMPKPYMDRLVADIQKKLTEKKMSDDQIRQECEIAIEKLHKQMDDEKGWMEKIGEGIEKTKRSVRNNETADEVNKSLWLKPENNLDQNGFSDLWLHGYNNEQWNFFFSIAKFETMIKTEKHAWKINSKMLANYFLYLDKKNQLNPTVLIGKFWGDILFQLCLLWKGSGKAGGLIAKHTLEKKGMGSILKVIDTFSSPNNFLEKIEKLGGKEEQEIAVLFLEKNLNSIQDAFRKDLLERFMKSNPKKKPEANAIIEKMMNELLLQTSLKGLPKVYEVLKKYNARYKLELNIQEETSKLKRVQEVKNKVDLAKNKWAQTKNQDPIRDKELRKERALLVRNGKDIEMSAKANSLMKTGQIDALASGEKKIGQVVVELRAEHKEFDTCYKAWEEEKKVTMKEEYSSKESTRKQDNETSGKEESLKAKGLSRESLISMPVGSEKTLSLSDKNTINIRKITGNQYAVKIGEHSEVRVLGSEIRGYVWSYRLLQNTGLESMINMAPNKLSQVIASCSKDGNRIDNTDGSFSKIERMLFLKAVATACGIGEKISHEYNINTVMDEFTKALRIKGAGSPGEWFRLLAQENGFMTKEGNINSDSLIKKIEHQW